MPSLVILLTQVELERNVMNSYGESLDAKAGVVLGFSGVLVGLGATAHAGLTGEPAFQAGLACGVLAAILATWAFLPKRYPVIQVERLRDLSLTAPMFETQLELLDTQIEMVEEALDLVRSKGLRLRASVAFLAAAAALVVVGTLIA